MRVPFEGASFEATLHEIKMMPSGEIRILFIAPDGASDEAVKLRNAYASSLQVSVERFSHAKK